VPGDIIKLQDGDQVPADCRLTMVTAFAVEEAILTGESVSINKVVGPVEKSPDGDCPIGDRKNMAFFGCVVSRGRAVAVVTATGMQTELGKIAKGIG